jgi:hypothetical protein
MAGWLMGQLGDTWGGRLGGRWEPQLERRHQVVDGWTEGEVRGQLAKVQGQL